MSTEENGGQSGPVWRVFQAFCFIVGSSLKGECKSTRTERIMDILRDYYDLSRDGRGTLIVSNENRSRVGPCSSTLEYV